MAKLSDVIANMEENASLIGAHIFLAGSCGVPSPENEDRIEQLKLEKLYLDGYINSLKQVTEL